jgi:uncharacterized protein HemY
VANIPVRFPNNGDDRRISDFQPFSRSPASTPCELALSNQQALKLKPDQPDTWESLGLIYKEKGKATQADFAFSQAIAYQKKRAEHTLLLAMESEGELSGRDEQPESGGHVTRIFTSARK